MPAQSINKLGRLPQLYKMEMQSPYCKQKIKLGIHMACE